jgi:hypothetical protein
MKNDPIVEEVRQIREAYAAQFNYDLLALFQDLKQQEELNPKIHHGYSPNASPNRPKILGWSTAHHRYKPSPEVTMPVLDHIQQDIQELPEEAQQLIFDFVSFLKQRYQPQANKPHQPINFTNQPLVGIWSDVPEMPGSAAWVRQTRQQQWQCHHK